MISSRLSFLFFLFIFSQSAFANTDNSSQQLGVLTQNVRGDSIEFSDESPMIEADSEARALVTNKIISEALELTGTPYKSGGTSPKSGFDCSGFVRYVFQQAANISLPASAKKIARIGKVIDKDALVPGDLVFFNTLKSPFSHVAIYIGDQSFIHAPSAGGVVRVDRMDIAYWSRHFEGARRVTID